MFDTRAFLEWPIEPSVRRIVDGVCLLFLARYFGEMFNDTVGGSSSVLVSLLGLASFWLGVISLRAIRIRKLTALLRALSGGALFLLQLWRWHSFGPLIGILVLASAVIVYFWGTITYGRAKRLPVAATFLCTMIPGIGLLLEMFLRDRSENTEPTYALNRGQLVRGLLRMIALQVALSVGAFFVGGMGLVMALHLPPLLSNIGTMQALAVGGGIGLLIGRFIFALIRTGALSRK